MWCKAFKDGPHNSSNLMSDLTIILVMPEEVVRNTSRRGRTVKDEVIIIIMQNMNYI